MHTTYKFFGFLKFSILKMGIPLLPQTCFTWLYRRPARVTSLSPTSPSQVTEVTLDSHTSSSPPPAVTPLLYALCVIKLETNWRWRFWAKASFEISVTLVIKKWSAKFISANKVLKERILEVTHLIFISRNLPTTPFIPIFTYFHHTWITAIVIPWNSLSSFSRALTQILRDTQTFLIKHCCSHCSLC